MSIDEHELHLLQHINAKLDTNRERIDQQFAHIEREVLLLNKRIHAMDARLTQAIADIAAIKATEERAVATLKLIEQMIADMKAKSDVATSQDLDDLSAAVAAAKASDAGLAAELDADTPPPPPSTAHGSPSMGGPGQAAKRR